MVLRYNSTSFEILDSVADGGDATFQAALVVKMTAQAGGGEKVGAIADDAVVLNAPSFFIAVETASVLSGTERKKSIQVTFTPGTIELNGTANVNVQLLDKDLVADPTSGVSVTLAISAGLIIPNTFVTDSNGQNPNPIKFKPSKQAGQASVDATATGFDGGENIGELIITNPTTIDKQQWLEVDDIKDDSITFEKRSGKENIRKSRFHDSWFIKKAILTQTFNPGLAQNINTIIVDDMGFLYVNGFVGPGATNPELKKLDKDDGTVVGTRAYTTNNLANRFDGMAYDGTNIWVASANHLLKIDAIAMTLTSDFTLAADGNFQFVAWDGEFIWSQLRGGTDADKDKIWKINPTTGTKVAAIDYRSTDPSDTAIREIKQVAMDEVFMYITGTGPATDWDRLDRGTSTVTHRGSGTSGTFGVAVDNRSQHIYIAGGTGAGAKDMLLEGTNSPPDIVVSSNIIDTNLWDLLFDSISVWTITGPTTRQLVRKVKFNPSTVALDVLQSFDLTTAFDPTSLAFDGKYLYVAGFGVTGSAVKKIFVGK